MARAADAPVIHIVKDRNCGCCTEWARVLQDDGFRVTMENQIGTVLARHKIDSGIPLDMTSCHTAHIDGYAIEGHVPPADIRRLLALRPDAVGLAVPGMPYGSPGMGPWDQRDAFDVFLIARDGTAQVFTHYDAA
ncbi:DUF411 domain-containing protein [Paracoccus sp. (in: a-proteobacteria)]|uniref:DUF411 domain-containing protein n=1 Tax=Paracoccus sp. TaxID=267 RepID=UPI0026DEB218|nr:DUF411 domain-containing protein [Paracoccus sp. (in: a-proteobacteria)]MDO5646602.1 DUF411 domain-containing protein [Paracoccus sp. (in: a-proteobacteria)]